MTALNGFNWNAVAAVAAAIAVLSGCGGGSSTDSGTTTTSSTVSSALVGLAIDATGQVLTVADAGASVVRSVSIATGASGTAAGSAFSNGSTDGNGSAARFNSPYGVARIGADAFVIDTANNTIRKLTASGVVTTVAGTALAVGSADSTGAAAGFSSPKGIATDGVFLYVADTGNQTIRRVTVDGVVTTVAGAAGIAGSVNGIPGSAARFNNPFNLAADNGALYVTDTLNNSVRKIVLATGAVTTLAGSNASTSGSADGVAGSAALFNAPAGIATYAGAAYVVDSGNATLRKVDLVTGATTTLAGQAGVTGLIDGTGNAARFNKPYGVVSDGAGALYVVDGGNARIRKVVVATGAVTTLSASF